MKHPLLILVDSEVRYQQALPETEAKRHHQQINGNNSGLLQRSKDFLIFIGQKLKVPFRVHLR